jgi:predicted Zn-dependent peptidase
MPNSLAATTGVATAQAVAAASHRYASTVYGAVQGGGQTASAEDVQRVARQYFVPENAVVVDLQRPALAGGGQ